ncbi:hypothetical protein CcaverHIS002_0507080 [Cutaneotrichosporon cavernicola]|nr:hypothetical protein CcaverHIS002_0507080 [Cutaneotrichosporon cavernicola]
MTHYFPATCISIQTDTELQTRRTESSSMNPTSIPLKGESMAHDPARRAAQLEPPRTYRNLSSLTTALTVIMTVEAVPQPTAMMAEGTASQSSSMATGATVGLALGLTVLLALAVLAVVLLILRRRKTRGPHVDPYAVTEAMPMATLRPSSSIIKRPGRIGVLSSVNNRDATAGHGWLQLDTEDRASLDSVYGDSTDPPSYDENGSGVWGGPSAQSIGPRPASRASTPTPGADATAFRVHGSNRNSAGFRMVHGTRADITQDWHGHEHGHGQERQARQVPRALRLDPIDTNRTAPPGPVSESPSTPTAQSPCTPRATQHSHLSHVTSFRGGELQRYDTFGRRREETPSALFDVNDATVQTAIAGQRAGPAWAPTHL